MAFQPDYRYGAAPGWGRAAAVDAAAIDAGLRAYMLRVYNWMASGLLLTAIVAYAIASIPEVSALFYTTVRTPRGIGVAPTILGWIAMFAPLAFVLALSFGINRMSKGTAQALFWTFAAVMGASLSNVFIIYTKTSVASTFFATSAMFAVMSIWGYTTKADLSRMGQIVLMGIVGLIIVSLTNIFLQSPMLHFIIGAVGVVLFCLLTAFDTQRIKNDYIEHSYAEGTDEAGKRSVMDALGLYLNFINIFQFLMQFMGARNQE